MKTKFPRSNKRMSDKFAKLIEMNKELYRPKESNKFGSINGTFGFGLKGVLFPGSLNGPFGTVNYPIPQIEQKMVSIGPSFNSEYGQFPKYNESTFAWRSRTHNYNTVSGLNINK